ncbi:hypothetical protein AHiyo6_10970 [Arthrobacter sp. Hiyo6]|nr:hypothetical protein AHiyo6_10970 [Arthrobacter sp. Hiyo6]
MLRAIQSTSRASICLYTMVLLNSRSRWLPCPPRLNRDRLYWRACSSRSAPSIALEKNHRLTKGASTPMVRVRPVARPDAEEEAT